MPVREFSAQEIMDFVILGAAVICLLGAIAWEIIKRDTPK